jgi:DNA-binding CsgD family transcriptional regulator
MLRQISPRELVPLRDLSIMDPDEHGYCVRSWYWLSGSRPQDLERIGLTSREAEVLHWVMKGKQDGAIAGILKISVRTVHHHIARILKKLQSESRASASYEAMLKLKALWSHPRPIQHSNTPSVRLLYPSTSAPSKIDLESKSA